VVAVTVRCSALALGAIGALGGCGLDMTGPAPWVPIDELAPPLIAELAPPPQLRSHAPPAPGVLRVVTYNVQYGPDIPAAADAIRNDPMLSAAGVVLVQEIEAYPDEGESRAARLAALLDMGFVYVPARVRDSGTHGLAILSPYAIGDVERMDLPESAQRQVRHRIAIRATLDVAGRPVHLVDVHLDTALAARERIASLHPAVVDAPGEVIVAGDFNTCWVEWAGSGVPVLTSSGASDQAPVLDSFMRSLAFDTPTAGSGPTEHMFGFEQRLDSIFTRDLDASSGGVVHAGPSDHWPLWIDVRL